MTEFDKVIPPGREGKVTASVKTDQFKGPIAKNVDVTTNDPANGFFELEIRADVQVAIDVKPGETLQINTKVGEPSSVEATLRSTDGRPFDILGLSPLAGLTASIAPLDADGKPGPTTSAQNAPAGKPLASGAAAYRLKFDMPAEFPVGRAAQSLTVATSHPKSPTLPLHLSLWVRGEVDVQPERVFLQSLVPAPVEGSAGPTPSPAPASMVVKLRKPQGAPLEIASVTSADPNITATVKPVAEGREYDLTVTLAANPGRVLTSKILVRTNVERQAEIAIPVYAKVLVLPPRGAPAAPNPRMPALPALPSPPAR